MDQDGTKYQRLARMLATKGIVTCGKSMGRAFSPRVWHISCYPFLIGIRANRFICFPRAEIWYPPRRPDIADPETQTNSLRVTELPFESWRDRETCLTLPQKVQP